MANNSKRNTNTSQFFITLDRAEELTGRHTLFGKIAGNTIFSGSQASTLDSAYTIADVLNIGNLEIDDTERPLVPPKIRGIRIIENPFDDIVPRITVAEKKAQARARAEAKKDADAREKRSRAKKWAEHQGSGRAIAERSPGIPACSHLVKQKKYCSRIRGRKKAWGGKIVSGRIKPTIAHYVQ